MLRPKLQLIHKGSETSTGNFRDKVVICCALVCLGCLGLVSAQAGNLERWWDERGISTDWRPQGAAALKGHGLPTGRYTLFVLPDCQTCSFRTIPLKKVLEASRSSNVIVAIDSRHSKLPAEWLKPLARITVLGREQLQAPGSWWAHAPFEADILLKDMVRIEVAQP